MVINHGGGGGGGGLYRGYYCDDVCTCRVQKRVISWGGGYKGEPIKGSLL